MIWWGARTCPCKGRDIHSRAIKERQKASSVKERLKLTGEKEEVSKT